MILFNFKNFNRTITLATVWLLFIAMAGLWVPLPTQGAENHKYIIQLTSQSGVKLLEKSESNIDHKFSFSNNPLFANIYSFDSTKSLPELYIIFKNNYRYIEPIKSFQASEVMLNDPGFTTSAADIDKQWGLVKAGFTAAWEKTTGSASNVVAVIDTGIDVTHEDLKKTTFVPGYNFLTKKDILGNVNSDDNGHGTLIAGVLGATPNNEKGIVGTNWQISLMPLKVLDEQGKGESPAVAESIVWAADHGAQIINMSLGGIGFGHDTTLSNAISYAFNKNVLIIAAAGNDVASTGGNLDKNPTYPICDDNNANMIIGVAATDFYDQKAKFSNYGKVCVDVSAPGRRILSTINVDPTNDTPSPDSYAYASGTSLAVPFVSGEAALLRSLYPFATNTQLRDLIIASTDPIDAINTSQCEGMPCTGLLGSGRINVVKAANAAKLSPAAKDGELIIIEGTNILYFISGGQKKFVSPFVYNQRFPGTVFRSLPAASLADIPEGPAEAPLTGTLVKLDGQPAVYYISDGKKLPVTYQVFLQRNLKFSDVITVDTPEFNTWVTGNFLAPLEGTMLRTGKSQTVYWVVSGMLHPINYNFYIERGLQIFPVMYVADGDMENFPKGEAYIR